MLTAQTVDAGNLRGDYWSLSEEQRTELCNLVRDHGYDPNGVRSVTYDVIDTPLLRIREYLTDNGRRYIDPATNDAATWDYEVALRSPLPAWWNPNLG
jgi:hypothetical protein